MSTIGSCVILNRSGFEYCLELARNIKSGPQKPVSSEPSNGMVVEDFHRNWNSHIVEEITFDYSGYALGNYIDAQGVINGIETFGDDTEAAELLAKIFMAGFPFERPVDFPDLPDDKLEQFCREEFGTDDAQAMTEAIYAAHEFYRQGLLKVTTETVAVFVIS